MDAARRVLELEGPDALTMRRLGEKLGIKAPSIYKHFPDKAALELALVEQALVEIGNVLHGAIIAPRVRNTTRNVIAELLRAYRIHSVNNPNLYRLATSGPLARDALPPGLEDWAGEPFLLATRDPHKAQALWSFAHGMVILEIDGRFPEDSELERTWDAGVTAFGRR